MEYLPIISVIIPVYNVENYLCQCLDTVLNQTLKNIEVICVNDGSTDNSSEILKEYAARDSRIIVLNQKNSGAGAARNRGLSIARGEFLSFLDSDDFFEPDMLEKAYKACVKENADFVVFRSDRYDNFFRRFFPQPWTIRKDLLPSGRPFCYKDVPRDLFRLFTGWPWDKLYKREFVQSNNLLFQEQRTTNDLFFVYSALVKAERISVIDDVLAHHRTNNLSSLSNTREKSWRCFYDALLALRSELLKMGIYEEVEQSYINYALHFSLWNLKTLSGPMYEKLYYSLKNEFFKELKVNLHGKDYFWNKSEYNQYLKIMSNSIIHTPGTFRIMNFVAQKTEGLFHSLKSYGIRYTINKLKYEVFRR